MDGLGVREVDALDADRIAALTADYAFDDYGRVRGVPAAGANALLRERIAAAIAEPRTHTLMAEDAASGAPAGLLCVQRIPSDCALLGLEVAGIPFLLARAGHPAPGDVYRALIAGLAPIAKRAGYVHVSARTDTANLPAYHALTEAGFRLIETLVTLSYDTERRGTGAVDPGAYGFDGVVRPVAADDVPAVRSLAARRFTQNRYHRDEAVPNARAGELMAAWIESYCADPADHEVWVAEGAGGKLAGFLGHGLNRDLERHTGVLVSGRALLAVEDPRTRIGQMLSRAHTWQSRGDFKECDTQLDNYGMIKAAFNLDMDLVRTRYTFHRSFA